MTNSGSRWKRRQPTWSPSCFWWSWWSRLRHRRWAVSTRWSSLGLDLVCPQLLSLLIYISRSVCIFHSRPSASRWTVNPDHGSDPHQRPTDTGFNACAMRSKQPLFFVKLHAQPRSWRFLLPTNQPVAAVAVVAPYISVLIAKILLFRLTWTTDLFLAKISGLRKRCYRKFLMGNIS